MAKGPPHVRNLSLGAQAATVDSPPTIPAVYQAARITMFIAAGDLKTAAAVPAVATMLPPKYMYVSRILSLTYCGHTICLSTAPTSLPRPNP